MAELAGQPGRAVRLYVAARSLYQTIGAWTEPYQVDFDGHLAVCRAALGEAEFATALKDGRALTTAQAVTDILGNSSE